MIRARKTGGRWRWVCTECWPPVAGSTASFPRLLVSLRHHFRVRYYHHRHVAAVRARR